MKMGLASAAVALLIVGCDFGRSIELRQLPYPYWAALAISSDFHGDLGLPDFLDLMELLNSSGETGHGMGLGLEVGSSFWFFSSVSDEAFTYFEGLTEVPSRFAPLIRKYISAGYIDTLHSFGDFSVPGTFERKYAELALRELAKHGLSVPVWTNHGDESNLQNLNRGIRFQEGGDPGSMAYHADLTTKAGFRFFWNTRLTPHVGQERRLALLEFEPWDRGAPLRSLGRLASAYVGTVNIFDANRLLEPLELDDGGRVLSFVRFNNHPADIWLGAHGSDLDRQLSAPLLEALGSKGGYMVLYTHIANGFPFASDDLDALRRLAEKFHRREILVATTARLLEYALVSSQLRWSWRRDRDRVARIEIDEVYESGVRGEVELTAADLMGISFVLSGWDSAEIYLGGRRVEGVEIAAGPASGQTVVSIPWVPLRFDPSELVEPFRVPDSRESDLADQPRSGRSPPA
jgi:hypothetical protein